MLMKNVDVEIEESVEEELELGLLRFTIHCQKVGRLQEIQDLELVLRKSIFKDAFKEPNVIFRFPEVFNALLRKP